MKTRVYMIAILSMIAIAINAQTSTSTGAVDESIQSQQLVKPITSYDGTVYEPFDDSAPSDKSIIGARNARSKPGAGTKGSLGHGSDPGNQSEEYPIGDGVWAMLFCALAFAGVVALRRRAAKE